MPESNIVLNSGNTTMASVSPSQRAPAIVSSDMSNMISTAPFCHRVDPSVDTRLNKNEPRT